MSVDLNRLAAVYIKIRDARAELKKEFEARDNELKAKLEKLDAAMLNQLSEAGAQSVKTESGTVYRQEEITPTVTDWAAVYQYIRDNDAFEMLERRVKKNFVTEFMERHEGAIPPGVSIFRQHTVRVRRS